MTNREINRNRSRWHLPFEFFAGPLLWAVQLLVGYGLVSVSCNISSNWPVLLTVFLSAIIVLTAAYLAYRSWRTMSERGGPQLIDTDQDHQSWEFIAISGFFVSSLFFLLVLTTAVAAFFLSPCPVNTMPFP
jgi:hypothetical protein